MKVDINESRKHKSRIAYENITDQRVKNCSQTTNGSSNQLQPASGGGGGGGVAWLGQEIH